MQSTWARYLLPIIAIGLAAIARVLLTPYMGEYTPYTTFYPAVMLVALYAGLWPAVIATSLSCIAASFWIAPFGSPLIPLMHIITGMILFIASNAIIITICVLLRNTQRDLQQNEERLRMATEASDIGYWDWDIEQNLQTWNDKCKEIFGLPPDTQVSHDAFLNAVHPDDRLKIDSAVRKSIECGEYDMEYRTLQHDGTVRWVHAIGKSICDKENKPLRMSGIVMDITMRKFSEEILRKQRAFLEEVIDASPSMIFVKDWDGRFVLVNKALAACYGKTIDEIIGKTDADFNPNVEEVAHFLQDDREVMTTKQNKWIREEPVTCADGPTKWFTTIKVPLIDEDGNSRRVLGVATDITDRKRSEETLRQSESRLQNQTKELETIIGIVSHDLRAPLMNVRGFNKFIKNDCEKIHKLLSPVGIQPEIQKELDAVLDQSMIEATGFIESSAEAMSNLVETLVKVARAGLVVPRPEALDMNNIISEVIKSIQIKFKDTGIEINAENLPPCFADKMHMTQIFTNLIDNAAKYLDPNRKGEICISGCMEKDHVLYHVSDNGIGIAAEHQEKVFDVYYRIAEKAAVGGEGIGLSVVKRMVDRNNGRIWLISEKGSGSTFYIALPLPPK